MEGRIKRMSCTCREFDVTEILQEDVARIPRYSYYICFPLHIFYGSVQFVTVLFVAFISY
jgi:hypothetical protein